MWSDIKHQSTGIAQETARSQQYRTKPPKNRNRIERPEIQLRHARCTAAPGDHRTHGTDPHTGPHHTEVRIEDPLLWGPGNAWDQEQLGSPTLGTPHTRDAPQAGQKSHAPAGSWGGTTKSTTAANTPCRQKIVFRAPRCCSTQAGNETNNTMTKASCSRQGLLVAVVGLLITAGLPQVLSITASQEAQQAAQHASSCKP